MKTTIIALIATTFLFLSGVSQAEPLAEGICFEFGTTELELTSVVRRNEVLTVKWRLRQQTSAGTNKSFKFDKEASNTSYVLDEERGVKYYVLTDTEGNPIATTDSFRLSEGMVKSFWMKLPAPPPEVSEVAVALTECELLDAIPITDK